MPLEFYWESHCIKLTELLRWWLCVCVPYFPSHSPPIVGLSLALGKVTHWVHSAQMLLECGDGQGIWGGRRWEGGKEKKIYILMCMCVYQFPKMNAIFVFHKHTPYKKGGCKILASIWIFVGVIFVVSALSPQIKVLCMNSRIRSKYIYYVSNWVKKDVTA